MREERGDVKVINKKKKKEGGEDWMKKMKGTEEVEGGE